MIEDIKEKLVKQVSPRDAFRFFAGSEHMNLPTMYAGGTSKGRGFTVVARDCERFFPAGRFNEATEFYRMILEEYGYL